MGEDDIVAVAGRLGAATDALAALGALIRIETEGLPVDPHVHAVLKAIAAELLGDQVLNPTQSASALGLAETFLRQGSELLANPGRAGSWDQVDVDLLQGIGRMSMSVAGAIQRAAHGVPALAERLAGPTRMLDVGTGTGWLAIALARAYPRAQVVGIDILEPALELAQSNVTAEGLGGRVQLRLQDVTTLDVPAVFDLVWLPLPFLAETLVPAALTAARNALAPGGWLVAGTFAAGDRDRLSELLMDLRTVRSGGRAWRPNDLLPLLNSTGFRETAYRARDWASPVNLFQGRRG